MHTNDPYARYTLRGDEVMAGDLTEENFESRVSQTWFTPTIERKRLKELMRRSDGPSLWNYGVWIVLMAVTGVAGYLTWGTVWCVPAFIAYGVLYSTSDHRAHELSHGTPFKTRWLNDAMYHVAGFMTLHEGHYWRWSHSRHHTHTIIVGRDPEIAFPRPVRIVNAILDLFYLRSGLTQIVNIFMIAVGRMTDAGNHFIPEQERPKVVRASRVYVLIFACVIGACAYVGSILPAMFIVLPRFYGGFMAQIFNVTQHAGLAENVHDHRLNTRTFHTNALFRWLYCNMNYHIEHHIFPMVPYHALPQLHEAIRSQCPPAYPSLWAAYREVLPALWRQSHDPAYTVARRLPAEQA
ncbi:fatty acid desaturase [Burkholderia sp. MR1-5-21]